jgi:glycosyltransferase involved in cell wall biosynthesis
MAQAIAIIIPTVDRAHLLPGLLESIEAATELEHHVYFVVEHSDVMTRLVLEDQHAEHELVVGDWGSYTAASNVGVRKSDEPLFLVANDDVVFHAGWDVAAVEAMRDPVRVVGVDQGNGRTDCFFLVDRRYLDGGDLYHPDYQSQWCDTEFAEVAKARGVWADAPGALIEHRHWTLGKAPVDSTYQKAIASDAHDRVLFEQRRKAWQA